MSEPFQNINWGWWPRLVGFIAATTLIWSGYFWWRPPAPMLYLKTISHLPKDEPRVSLTFDDSPHPLTTPLLLASLKRAQVQATFFVVGDGMQRYPELARRIVHDGHTLANHSQHHHNLTTVTPSEYSDEIFACFDIIKTAGKDQPWRETQLFRPPGGGLDRATMQFLYKHDITLAWWTNNVGDWAPLPAWRIAHHFSNSLRAGDIILLHDAGTSTPQAISAIVRAARERGLEFVPMPEN